MDVPTIVDKLSKQLVGGTFLNKVNIDLGNDGIIHISGTQTAVEISIGQQDADGTITTSLNNLLALAEGTLDPMTAFMTGGLKISGDMNAVISLQNALSD